MTAQLRRASSSIAANLAEGAGRYGDAELARYCSIAMGSASELEYHILFARDLKLLKATDYTELAHHTTEVKRMLVVRSRRQCRQLRWLLANGDALRKTLTAHECSATACGRTWRRPPPR